jgi:hypothetical protein
MQANLSSVRARRALIARQLNDLQTEDAELASVEDVLLRLSRVGAREAGVVASKGRSAKPGRGPARAITTRKAKANGAAKADKKGRGRRSGAGSQRELVLGALKKPGAGWMDIRQIIASVKDAHGVTIPPRSLSPLLSNLKKTGAIARQGRRVAIPGAARAR